MGRGNVYRETVAQMGKDGWLTLSWPKEFGGQAPPADGRPDLQRRGLDRQRPGAVPDHQQRRADDHGVRHRRAEEVLPAQDRRRRSALLDRLLRAGRGHRPRRAADHRGARRRRLRDQRPEDVDQPDRLRGLRVAGGAHQPGGQEAPRHLDADRADHRRGLLLDAGAHHGRRRHQRHLLPGRAGAGRPTWSARRTPAGSW